MIGKTHNRLKSSWTLNPNERINFIYFIFSIDSNNYKRNKEKLEFDIKKFNTRFHEFEQIFSEEKNNIKTFIYSVFYSPEDSKSPEYEFCLSMKLKDESNNIKLLESEPIRIKNKEFNYLYEHSFEDIKKNFIDNNKIILKIEQIKFTTIRKYTLFLRKIDTSKEKNKRYFSFIEDTFNYMKTKEEFNSSTLLDLLSSSYQNSYVFYKILNVIILKKDKIKFKVLIPKHANFLNEINNENLFIRQKEKK